MLSDNTQSKSINNQQAQQIDPEVFQALIHKVPIIMTLKQTQLHVERNIITLQN